MTASSCHTMCLAAPDPSRPEFAKLSSGGNESSTGGRETNPDSSTGAESLGSVNPSWSCRRTTRKSSQPAYGAWASVWPSLLSSCQGRVSRCSGGRVRSMLDDEEWESLSTLYNVWMDDVADILEGLAAAAQDAERSVAGTPLARAVVVALSRRIRAAVLEVIDRTNTLTVEMARFQA
jgi:hypothetical protein